MKTTVTSFDAQILFIVVTETLSQKHLYDGFIFWKEKDDDNEKSRVRRHLNGRIYKSTPDRPPRFDVIPFFPAITTITVQPLKSLSSYLWSWESLKVGQQWILQTLTFSLSVLNFNTEAIGWQADVESEFGDVVMTMQPKLAEAAKVGTSSHYLRGGADQARAIFCWGGWKKYCAASSARCWCGGSSWWPSTDVDCCCCPPPPPASPTPTC